MIMLNHLQNKTSKQKSIILINIYLFCFKTSIIMFANKLPLPTLGSIDNILLKFRKRFQQFAFNIFQRINPHQFPNVIQFIEMALFHFATNISESCLQAISSCVLYSFQKVIQRNYQGPGSMEKLVSNIIFGINKQIYSLRCQLEQTCFREEQEALKKQKGRIKNTIKKHNEKERQAKLSGFKDKYQIYKFAKLIASKMETFGQDHQLIFRYTESFVQDFSYGDMQQKEKKVSHSSGISQILNHKSKDKIDSSLREQSESLIINCFEQNFINFADSQNIKIQNPQVQPINQQRDYVLLNLKQKKLKKQKPLPQQEFKVQPSEQQKLFQLKIVCYQQIMQIRQKYKEKQYKNNKKYDQILKCTIQELILEKQNKFWYLTLTDYDIQQKILLCDESKLSMLEDHINKQIAWLQRGNLKSEQICREHNSKTYYLCSNAKQKEEIYICNQCLINEQQQLLSQRHQRPEIICRKHKKQIKYKLREPNQQQTFLCSQCIYFIPKQKYVIISSCHYRPILQLCTQVQCIQGEQFMLCLTCQALNGHHRHHRKVKFDRESLTKIFYLNNQVDIVQYQKQLIKAQEILKLNPLEKIRISFAKKILPISIFLESFSLYNNNTVEKWINRFMDERKKEDLMVLNGVRRMNEENLKEKEKGIYLQAFNYVLGGELQQTFEHIWGTISQSCQRIIKWTNNNKQSVVSQLNEKYKQVFQTQIGDKATFYPMKLSQIDPIYHQYIQKIKFIKEREQQRDQKIYTSWRYKRGMFFKQYLKKKLCEYQIGQQQQRIIKNQFLLAKQSDFYYLTVHENLTNQFECFQEYAKNLEQSFNKQKNQFKQKLNDCLPWSFIIKHQFINLKVIHIQYDYKNRYKSIQLKQYYYSIDAIKMFQFINDSPQLEQVFIIGVQLVNIQEFINIINTNHPIQYGMPCLKVLKPWRSLRLALDFKYQLHLNNDKHSVQAFSSRLQNFQYFKSQFRSLSHVTLLMRLENNKLDNCLKRLLLCLREIKNIKIKIKKINQLLLRYILNELSSFTEIAWLVFDQIQLNSKTSADDFSLMEQSLACLFDNNKVTRLQINLCKNFPVVPYVTTLQLILGEFDFNYFIKINRQLRWLNIQQIKRHQIEIKEKIINQLQQLIIFNCNGLSFEAFQSPSPSKIKSLAIMNGPQFITDVYNLFPKLANLTQLTLGHLNFNYQFLSVIPSAHLNEIVFWGNDEVTNECLERIDRKWPYIKKIQFIKCQLISERMFELCNFKSLMEIGIQRDVFSSKGQKYLKIRGIQQI